MRFSSSVSLALGFALVLSACGQAVTVPATPQGSGDAVMDVIGRWTPTVAWSAPVQGTNRSDIFIDEEHMIDAGRLSGTIAKAQITPDQFEELFMGTDRNELGMALGSSGWSSHLEFDADGATGTQWGYIKTDAAGQRFLMISANGTQCTTDAETPVVCSAYEASVYLSDTLTAGDDM